MTKHDFQDLDKMEQELWWFQGMTTIMETILRTPLRRFTNPSILDVGCGTGGVMKWFHKFSSNVAGLDIAEDALDYCRKKKLISLYLGSATHLPVADESIDILTCLDVLVQLPGENDDREAVKEMVRVLAPGGYAFVRVAAYNWMRSSHDETLHSQRRYDRRAISRMLAKAGFQIEFAGYANAFLFPLAVIHRKVLQPLGITSRGSDVRPLPGMLSFLNKPFRALLSIEASLMRAGISLPFGLSVIVLVRKPEAGIQGS